MSQNNLGFSAQNQEVLDSAQLDNLERSYRAWVGACRGKSRYASRVRIFVIFLLIRYTGAKLNEVLGLNLARDVDLEAKTVFFDGGNGGESRKNAISDKLAAELQSLLGIIGDEAGLGLNPAYVRKQFYELAQRCGLDKKYGGPEMLRKARAIEMLRNVPLPAVQHILGHSSPNLTSSYVAFSEEDLNEVARLYVERESGRKTSARNSFHGKVLCVKRSDIQTLVEMLTPGGCRIVSLITNTSADALGLAPGKLITAEVKAPLLTLECIDREGTSSAENQLAGVLAAVSKGKISVECIVTLEDTTEMCAILTVPGFQQLQMDEGQPVRVLFGAHSVVLHVR